MESIRVLSIQSHVISGKVGNRAAIFPLQLLGFDADFINSVNFSNHTKYPLIKGTVMTGNELETVVQGLEANYLLDYDYLLTGYIGSESFLSSILQVLDKIKINNPNVRYVCDPVLGDNGRYYVPPALVDIFRTVVVPRAYMITPNQFEAELLSGVKIIDQNTALQALAKMVSIGPQIVVLTSCEFPESSELLHCYAMKRCIPSDSNETTETTTTYYEVVSLTFPKMEGHYTGTGDCTAALLLAWIHLTQANIQESLLKTISSLQAILKLTQERQHYYGIRTGSTTEDITHNLRYGELAVVYGKKFIENPPIPQDNSLNLNSWRIDDISNLLVTQTLEINENSS
mmetsp:Transcript_6627/g.6934  ORF Transcript_6627/g.6934 Transcript_6627/m.6934 type:complete len:344 (+) Transcript_6627:34-1065(+)